MGTSSGVFVVLDFYVEYYFYSYISGEHDQCKNTKIIILFLVHLFEVAHSYVHLMHVG